MATTKAHDLARLLADGVVGTSEIGDDQVTTAKIPDNAVTTAKIANSAVTADKINIASSDVPYDNTVSGLSANTVKEAIDALNAISGGGNAGAQATFSRQKFTATAGQTSFTITDGYDVGYILVFMNGVLLDQTDFTGSDGSTVSLSTGARAGDEIVVIKLDSFAIAELLRVTNISASAPDDNITLNSSGYLGLGTTNPARQLTVSNSGAALLLLESTGNDNSQVLFGDNDSDTVGKVMYRHGDNRMTFNTGGEERFHIRGDGSVVSGDVAVVTEKLAGYHFLDDSYSYWSTTLGRHQAAMRVETKWDAAGGTRAAGTYGGGIAFNHLGGHSASHDGNTHAFIGLKVWDTPAKERSSLVFATNDRTDSEDAGLTERMAIDPYGRVTTPYQPFLMAFSQSGNYASQSGGRRVWGGTGYVAVNRGNCWNSSTKVFTAPVAGVYLVRVSIRMSSQAYSSGSQYNYIYIHNSNSSQAGTPIRLWSPGNEAYGYRPHELTALMPMNANDTIYPEFYNPAGTVVLDGGTTGQTDGSLSIMLIG